MGYTEFSSVKKEIMSHLKKCGWHHSSPFIRDINTLINFEKLKEHISLLNPHIDVSEDIINRIIAKINQLPYDDFGNKEFIAWLKGERGIPYGDTGNIHKIKLIDYENVHNNSFEFITELQLNGSKFIRPDFSLFINGMPLIIIDSYIEPYKTRIEAIDNIISYTKVAPKLVNLLCFFCVSNSRVYYYGWSNPRSYSKWDENSKIGIPNLFNKFLILKLIKNYVIFEVSEYNIRKNIAPQHIYQISEIIFNKININEGGLIQQQIGTGRTYSYLYAINKLHNESYNKKFKNIIILDRMSIVDQYFDLMIKNGLRPIKYIKNMDLTKIFKSDLNEVIIITKNSFEDIINNYQIDEYNINIFIDEIFRSESFINKYLNSSFSKKITFGFFSDIFKSNFKIGDVLFSHSLTNAIEDNSMQLIEYNKLKIQKLILKEYFINKIIEINKIIPNIYYIKNNNYLYNTIQSLKDINIYLTFVGLYDDILNSMNLYDMNEIDEYHKNMIINLIVIYESYNKLYGSGKFNEEKYNNNVKIFIKNHNIIKYVNEKYSTTNNILQIVTKSASLTNQESDIFKQYLRYKIKTKGQINPIYAAHEDDLSNLSEKSNEDVYELTKNILEIDEDMKKHKLSETEYALLLICIDNMKNIEKKKQIDFVKNVLSQLYDEKMLFKGWDAKRDTYSRVERKIFSIGNETFKEQIEPIKMLDIVKDMTITLTNFEY